MVNPFPLRAAGLLLSAATLLLLESAALGADPPASSAPKPWETAPNKQRGGFTVGFSAGLGVASVVGFPNDPKKLNRARYYTETGTRPATSGGLWFGGALADWFTFGVGFNASNMFATGDNKVTTVGFIFHLEGFPLLGLGGRLQDLGVMFDAGLGAATVTSDKTNEQLVGGAGCSIIGGGPFYEGIRFWKIHGGPFLAGTYYWSDTVRRPGIFLGWRMALYTKP